MARRVTLEDAYPANDDDIADGRCAKCGDGYEEGQPVVWVPADADDPDSNLIVSEHFWCAIENGEVTLTFPSLAEVLRFHLAALEADRAATLAFGEPTLAERRLLTAVASVAAWLESRGPTPPSHFETAEFFCPDCPFDPQRPDGHAETCRRVKTCGQTGPPWLEELHPQEEWADGAGNWSRDLERHRKAVEHTTIRPVAP